MSRPLVVAITGASGAVYALRLLQVLHGSGRDVHLLVSPSGRAVLAQELGLTSPAEPFDAAVLLRAAEECSLLQPGPKLAGPTGAIRSFHPSDFMAPAASGSFLTDGMVVCPCSGSTLSAIATGASNNLIHRAADVHLKERRKLILVPRETPLSLIQLNNLRRAAEAGAVILPAMPGWYHGVETIADLVDFVVARILDQLEVPHALTHRWGE